MSNVVRLISASKSDFETMTPMDLKESIYKSEGRVIMGQHLLFAGAGLVHAIGDGGFAGCTSPENIHQLSVSIKGRPYTYFRMASTNI